jgi:hypothetical protein
MNGCKDIDGFAEEWVDTRISWTMDKDGQIVLRVDA